MNGISKLALVFIVVGAVVLAGPTFGFSSIIADRGANVETAAAEDALLGINATDQTVTVAGNDDNPQEIGTLSNNFDQTAAISVAVEHIPNGSDGILQAGPVDKDVSSGDSTTATVKCTDATTLGTEDVVFRAEADGSSVQVVNATFTVSIDIQCGSGGGNIDDTGLADVSANNLTATNNEIQRLSFTLSEEMKSTETVNITLQGVQNQHQLDYTGATLEADTSGSFSRANSGSDYEIGFSPNETLERGDTVTIIVDGIDASGKNAVKKAPYDVEFSRSDKGSSTYDSFNVSN